MEPLTGALFLMNMSNITNKLRTLMTQRERRELGDLLNDFDESDDKINQLESIYYWVRKQYELQKHKLKDK